MDKSIAFIMCVNDENKYEECVRYINSLYIPDGFKKEIIAVRNSRSMASGYNYAMNKSKAKYKVYLHQDTMIINKNFIYDILDIFMDDKVGMIGAIGCEKLPPNAIWWNSSIKYGKVYEGSTGSMRLLESKLLMDKAVKEVQAIDGFIMITQYDIPWRDDIFDGYHFYDIAQCMEFQRNNLSIVVPKQEKPWFLHDCKIPNFEGYDFYKDKFFKEYYKILDDNKISFANKIVESICDIADKKNNIEEKLVLTEFALRMQSDNSTGSFRNIRAEEMLHDIGKKYVNKQYEYCPKKNEVLHVVTEVYNTGGHTRLLNNVIKFDNKRKHSLLINNDKNIFVPTWLEESIRSSGGKIITNESDKYVDKARVLRKLSYSYDNVILYTHPFDIIPSIAFAEKVNSRIMYYNHADHIFNIGGEIADCILDLSEEGSWFTKNIRKLDKSLICPIPIEEMKKQIQISDRKSILNKIGIDDVDKKIVLSIASSYKYRVIDGYNFPEFAVKLANNMDINFLIVGPSVNELVWKDAFIKSNGRVKALGILQKEELEQIESIADVYIDSFPMNSYTCSLEAAEKNIPVFSLNNPLATLDALKLDTYKDVEDLYNNVCASLNEDYIKDNYIFDYIKRNHYKDGWLDNYEKIINNTKKEEKILLTEFDKEKYDRYLLEAIFGRKVSMNKIEFEKLSIQNQNEIMKNFYY